MSINWGEIVRAQYKNNKKVGNQERLLNTGFCLHLGEERERVSFPYANEDYYEGKVRLLKGDYGVLFVAGEYH